MGTRVTGAEIDTYRSDGVVCIRRAIEPHWIELLRSAVDEAMRQPSELATDYANPGEGRFFADYNMWRRIDSFREFEFGSGAGEVAGALMGCDRVQLYTEHLLVKEPGSLAAETPWHQDAPYSKVEGGQFGSLWIAIDPTTVATGAMEFAAGSHTWEDDFGTPEFAQANADRSETEVIEDAIAEHDSKLVSYELEPGDCTFHHCRTLHRAGGNASATTRRRGLSLRLIGDDVGWAAKVQSNTEAEYARLNSDLQLPAGSKLPEERFPVLWRAGAAA